MLALRWKRLQEDASRSSATSGPTTTTSEEPLADLEGTEGLLGQALPVGGRRDHTAQDHADAAADGTSAAKTKSKRSERKGIEQITSDSVQDGEEHAGKHVVAFRRPAFALQGEKPMSLNAMANQRRNTVRRNRTRVNSGSTALQTRLTQGDSSVPVLPKGEASGGQPQRRFEPQPVVTGYAIAS